MNARLRKIVRISVVVALAWAPRALQAEAKRATWFLPRQLSDENSSVRFEVDTTWHVVHGTTSGIKGKVDLVQAGDASQIQYSVEIPVGRFDTGDSDRDDELREILAAPAFPRIVLSADRAILRCTPEAVTETEACSDTLRGELQIRSTRRQIEIPIQIRSQKGRFRISGEFPVKWAEYGVEDPSIFLLAKVDPVVTVKFEVILAPAALTSAGLQQ